MDIFTTQSKNLKTYTEKVSELILKEKLRLRQLAGIYSSEIVVPFANVEIFSLWAENRHWQRDSSNFLGEICNNYPQTKRLHLKRELTGTFHILYMEHQFLEPLHSILIQIIQERQVIGQEI